MYDIYICNRDSDEELILTVYLNLIILTETSLSYY